MTIFIIILAVWSLVVLAKLIYEYIKARREVREARKDAMLTDWKQ
jgi:hypothetical protein